MRYEKFIVLALAGALGTAAAAPGQALPDLQTTALECRVPSDAPAK